MISLSIRLLNNKAVNLVYHYLQAARRIRCSWRCRLWPRWLWCRRWWRRWTHYSGWRRNLVNITSGLYGIRPVFTHSDRIDEDLNVAVRIWCRAWRNSIVLKFVQPVRTAISTCRARLAMVILPPTTYGSPPCFCYLFQLQLCIVNVSFLPSSLCIYIEA